MPLLWQRVQALESAEKSFNFAYWFATVHLSILWQNLCERVQLSQSQKESASRRIGSIRGIWRSATDSKHTEIRVFDAEVCYGMGVRGVINKPADWCFSFVIYIEWHPKLWNRWKTHSQWYRKWKRLSRSGIFLTSRLTQCVCEVWCNSVFTPQNASNFRVTSTTAASKSSTKCYGISVTIGHVIASYAITTAAIDHTAIPNTTTTTTTAPWRAYGPTINVGKWYASSDGGRQYVTSRSNIVDAIAKSQFSVANVVEYVIVLRKQVLLTILQIDSIIIEWRAICFVQWLSRRPPLTGGIRMTNGAERIFANDTNLWILFYYLFRSKMSW